MSTGRDDLRRELGRRLDAFRSVPFPADEADDDRLGELHAELAEYDGYVIGLASSVAGFMDVDPRRLEPRPELRHALQFDAIRECAHQLARARP